MNQEARRAEQLALARALRRGYVTRVRTVAEPPTVIVHLFAKVDDVVPGDLIGWLERAGFKQVPAEIEPPPGAVSMQYEVLTNERHKLAREVQAIIDHDGPAGIPWVKR